MKCSPAATLFVAACVVLALSSPPLVAAQRHTTSVRVSVPRGHGGRRVVVAADDDEGDDDDNDNNEDDSNDGAVNDVPKPKTTAPTTTPPATTTPVTPPASGNCRRIVRQEIRDLTTDQRTRYFRAIRAIMRRPAANQPSEYDRFVYEHQHYNVYNHGTAAFLPWHRIFIRRFEMALQRVDASVVLPYWDWSADAQAPELSVVFSPDWYGGNGNTRRRGCIEDGVFKDFVPYYTNGNQGCISRHWNGGRRSINAFVYPEMLANYIARSSDYNSFRLTIEGQPHAAVHNGIGSTFSTMYSPSDPIFWLHHGMIDKLFMDWQLLAPSTRVNQFNGVDQNKRSVTPSSLLVPYNVPARVGLQFNVLGACVSYAPAVNAYRGRRVPTTVPPPRTNTGSSGNGRRPVRRPPPPTRHVVHHVVHKRPPPRRRIHRRDVETSQVMALPDDNGFPVNPARAAQQSAAPAPKEAAPTAAPAETAPVKTAAATDAAADTKVDTKVDAIAVPNAETGAVPKALNQMAAPKADTPAPADNKPKQADTSAEQPQEQPEKKADDKPQKVDKADKKESKTDESAAPDAPKADDKEQPATPALNATSSVNATAPANSTDLSGTKVVVVDKPKPSDLPKTCKDAQGNVTPCPDDRENILDLRAPAPIPEEWILSNGLDVETIRKQEEETRSVASKLNALDGYVSPAALWNRDDFLAKLAKRGTDFKCVYKGKVIKVDYDKDSVTTGYRTIEKVKKQIERVGVPTYKPVTYLEPQLNKILGHKAVKRLKNKYGDSNTVYGHVEPHGYGGDDKDDDDVCEADDDY